ncbi:MAG: type II secretory pathway predicted ATPase ExeA [Candidatus Latescibacterota bacterium]
MYEAYWGLDEKPFENTPDPRFLFQSDGASTIYRLALYALQNNRGAVMLTGESGCGKTLMARALVQELDPDKTEVALLTNPRWTTDEFMMEILYQLGHEEELQGRTKIVHRLHEVLYENFEAGKSTLVLIDEGQLIQDQDVLEEIRLLLNYQLNDAFLISLLLVGQTPMAQEIRGFAPLDQRIVTRGSLKPLGLDEAGQYVAHRLKVAGRSEPIFTPDAIERVNEYAQGIPRKINNICDIALVVGFSRKLVEVDAEWVQRLIRAEGSHGA